jgi:hypothetical protein
MKHWILAAAMALALAGCASSQTIEESPLDSGISRDFEAGFEPVREAARQTLQNDMPGMLSNVSQREEAYIFHIEIGANAFNWGEVGRVVIIPVDEGHTRVVVRSEKRLQTQVTGRGEQRLSEQLFAGIERRLAAGSSAR